MSNLLKTGNFTVISKWVDADGDLLLFEWSMDYPVEGAIATLPHIGETLVDKGSLSVNSNTSQFRAYVLSKHGSDFFDLTKIELEQLAPAHVIKETCAEVE